MFQNFDSMFLLIWWYMFASESVCQSVSPSFQTGSGVRHVCWCAAPCRWLWAAQPMPYQPNQGKAIATTFVCHLTLGILNISNIFLTIYNINYFWEKMELNEILLRVGSMFLLRVAVGWAEIAENGENRCDLLHINVNWNTGTENCAKTTQPRSGIGLLL